MNIIKQLKRHEKDELDEWMDKDENESKKFLLELVQFAQENFDEIRQYCQKTVPGEFSSLSIVYQALSEHSTGFNEFLFEEIQRVVELAKSKKIHPELLEVLTDIETENIYAQTRGVYIQIMNYLTENLQLGNDRELNYELLDVVDCFLLELDEDDEITESKEWVNRLKVLAEEAELSVKMKAREVLENFDDTITIKPISLMERIKGLFR